jgi:hypothetical protein
MEGRNGPLHRTQGGCHGQYNRATPLTVGLEAAARNCRCPPPPTGPIASPEPAPEATALAGAAPPGGPPGRAEPPPTQADLRPAPRAGPHRLRAAGKGPDPTDLPAPRLAGAGCHSHHRRPHHRPPAPHPRRTGPGPPQQLSPRPLPPPLARPPAGPPLHRRRVGPLRPPRPGRAGWRRHRHRTPRGHGLRHGKGCHRDPVRSTHSFTAYRWGHNWVVLALLARLPFCHRRWAQGPRMGKSRTESVYEKTIGPSWMMLSRRVGRAAR